MLLGYNSRYSGSFDLLDTVNYPKMCADRSIKMENNNIEYYRGQNELTYVIEENSNPGIVEMINSWMFQNGTNAEDLLGRWDKTQGILFISTDSQEAEG